MFYISLHTRIVLTYRPCLGRTSFITLSHKDPSTLYILNTRYMRSYGARSSKQFFEYFYYYAYSTPLLSQCTSSPFNGAATGDSKM